MIELNEISFKDRSLRGNTFFISLISFTFLGLFPIVYALIDLLFKGLAYVYIQNTYKVLELIRYDLLNSMAIIIISLLLSIIPSLFLAISIYEFSELKLVKSIKFVLEQLNQLPVFLHFLIVYLFLKTFNQNLSIEYALIAFSLLMITRISLIIHNLLSQVSSENLISALNLGLKKEIIYRKILFPVIRKDLIVEILKIMAFAIGLTIPFLFLDTFELTDFSTLTNFIQSKIYFNWVDAPISMKEVIFSSSLILLIIFIMFSISAEIYKKYGK